MIRAGCKKSRERGAFSVIRGSAAPAAWAIVIESPACQIETFSRGALNGPVSVNLFRDTPGTEKRNPKIIRLISGPQS